jgi:endonuclease III-like uncharacterized protein
MAKGKMGRNRKQLEEMKFDGWDLLDAEIKWASAEYLAEKLGMSADSLSRRIKERYGITFAEYKHKRQETIRINILKKQYEIAMGGNVTMLIYLGKQYCGQKEQVEEVVKQEVKQEITYATQWGSKLPDETNS